MNKDLQRKVDYAKKLGAAKSNTMTGLLGLDPATMCGWACSDGTYGLWNLDKKQHESAGMRWLKFEKLIRETCKEKNITVIAFEEASGTHINAVKHHAKLTGVIERFCEENGIECAGYNVKVVKKFLTDNGNASKAMMIEAAKKHFGYEGDSNDEADAIAVLNLLKSEI